MSISEQIQNLKPQLETLIESNHESLESIKTSIQKLVEVSSEFGKNWIGQWASHNYNYYSNFSSENGGTVELTKEDIQEYIEKTTGITIKSLKESTPDLVKINREFRDEVVTELSVIRGNESLQSENDILDKIEKEDWGITSSDYVKMQRPKSIITYDPEQILNKGLDTPPHYRVDGELMSIFTRIASIETFHKNTKRLLRQLELRFVDESTFEETTPDSPFIYQLIEQFHTVANQLRNRYNKRDTILINDEYDVQDLLHGLLKIQFQDVRPEEYTPSYAGSSTRVDFLLKREKIVIEVKKTREGLTDKKIGDQLILDTQHYKAHPDCKHLICFVYDPEGRIQNPRGLESDLNNISNEELLVEVFIRP